MKTQKGFSAVEGLLILVIVGLLSFTGWYVYNSQKSANNIYSKSQKTSANSALVKTDSTANWKSFSSTSAMFSVKYPETWAVGAKQENCPDFLMLGPSAAYAGKCQTEATPEVGITSVAGDKQVDYALVKKYYPDLKKVAVSVNGINGYMYSGTLNSPEPILVGPPNGTKSAAYVFYTAGRTYVATYNQIPGAPDVMSEFERIFTKTMQFHE